MRRNDKHPWGYAIPYPSDYHPPDLRPISRKPTKYKISCVVIPMDGYHFSISKLKAMKDPEDVIYRRGAPDTFDAELLRNDLTTIKNGSDNEKSIPGFDHQIGDPSPDQHLFKRNLHRVVIVEGLYLLHEDEKFGWHGIKVGLNITIQ